MFIIYICKYSFTYVYFIYIYLSHLTILLVYVCMYVCSVCIIYIYISHLTILLVYAITQMGHFFSFIFISWRLITLQYCNCIGFCHTLTWISHGFTCVPHSDHLVAQMVKNLLAMQETRIWSLGWEDSLENGMATHFSILAWWIPRTEGSCGLHTVHGVVKSLTWLSN